MQCRRIALLARQWAPLTTSVASTRLSSTTATSGDDALWSLDADEETPASTTTPSGIPTAPPVAAVTSGPPAGSTPPDSGKPTVVAKRRTIPSEVSTGSDATDPEWMSIGHDELHNRVTLYLSTCRARAFINPVAEAQMFPVLIRRVGEFDLGPLLDIIEAVWPRETAERYFEPVSNAVRSRILEVVETAELNATPGLGLPPMDDGSGEPSAAGAGAASLPVILVARCIVVMGLKGRRRRDLELFKPLGQALSSRINDIRDPHTLCYVLIAFQSSRIRPPNEFLALVGRRLPVLNKKYPMAPLPAYRALSIYDRAAYDLLNPYRFLADRVMAHIKSELQKEGGGKGFIEPRVITPMGGRPRPGTAGEDDDDLDDVDFAMLREIQSTDGRPAPPSPAPATDPEASTADPEVPTIANESVEMTTRWEAAAGVKQAELGTRAASEKLLDSAMPDYAIRPDGGRDAAADGTSAGNPPAKIDEVDAPQQQAPVAGETKEGGTEAHKEDETTSPLEVASPTLLRMAERRRVRARFFRLTQLRPPQLTKLLVILGRKYAPRQQYLRPIANDVLVPSLEHFNPPSFSRLIRAMREFHSEESTLIAKVVDVLVERGPKGQVVLCDLLDMLFLLSRPNVPLTNAEKFFELCRTIFADGSRLRPRDMLVISSELLLIRKLKFDEEDGANTPAFHSLVAVIDSFAARMASFLELGLLEPHNADALLAMCEQLRPGAEPSDSVARLMEAKRATLAQGEEAYMELLPIDVRDTFFRIQAVNSVLTHRGFRPINAQTMQGFKAMLDYMRADTILEAVHLYEQAYPQALSVPVRRVVGSFLVDKLRMELEVAAGRQAPPPPPQPELVPLLPGTVAGDDGEQAVAGHRRVYKPFDVTAPKFSPLLFTPASLTKFANMVFATPLLRVQRSPETWKFLRLKARQFQSQALLDAVTERLATAEQDEVKRQKAEMRHGEDRGTLDNDPEAFL